MTKFEHPISPEFTEEHVRLEVLKILKNSGLKQEEQKQILLGLIAEINQGTMSPSSSEETITGYEQEDKPATYFWVSDARMDSQGKYSQIKLGTFYGEQLDTKEHRKEFRTTKIEIDETLQRNQLEILAQKFNFSDKLHQLLLNNNSDHFSVHFECNIPPEIKAITRTPLNIYEGEAGMQELSQLELPSVNFEASKIKISYDLKANKFTIIIE